MRNYDKYLKVVYNNNELLSNNNGYE